jgi:photosystem II stability/assembly factor-like uncharacterized protein
MLKLFYIIIIFSFLSVTSFSQWQVISTQGNEAVSFPSSNTGYSTANGVTKKTINGGINWSTLSGGNLTGIFFINDMTGWVVGYPGYIGRTTNGSSFTQEPTAISDRLNDVFFINDNTGWVVGGDFSVERIFKTTNAGTNWNVQTSGTANKLFSVYFIDAMTGWSVGGPSAPKIIKTTNGGDNWFTQSTTVGTPLYGVMFSDANTGWAVAGYIGGETIIKTTNGGTNWFSQSSGDNRYLRDCYVRNSSTAFGVGQGGKLIWTTNGGDNWVVQVTGSTVELWSIDFANDSIGYAIGDNVVLKTTNGGVVFVNSTSNTVPENFVLYQNYPNPFNPTTKITFTIPLSPLYSQPASERERGVGGFLVSLKIFDLLGNEIATLVNEQLSPGTYETEWSASSYSSGVYFYRLTSGDFLETKRMVLVK